MVPTYAAAKPVHRLWHLLNLPKYPRDMVMVVVSFILIWAEFSARQCIARHLHTSVVPAQGKKKGCIDMFFYSVIVTPPYIFSSPEPAAPGELIGW